MSARTSARLLLLPLSLLVLAVPSVGAEIYRWTDANGRVHFSNQKPAGEVAGPVETFHGKARVSFVEGNGGGDGVVAAKVRMFTTSWCPVCKKAKTYLQLKGIAFEELNVETSPEAKREFERLGGKGVPVILVGGQRMDGFDAGHMDGMLAEAGL